MSPIDQSIIHSTIARHHRYDSTSTTCDGGALSFVILLYATRHNAHWSALKRIYFMTMIDGVFCLDASVICGGWWPGVAVTCFIRRTKLLYAGPS